MVNKKYLVTGGDGFIGSNLVRRLVKEEYGVKVLDNGLRGAPRRLRDIAGKIETVHADIRDTKAVRRACKGVDAVCHLAYLNGTEFFYEKPDLVLDIGVKGIVNVIDSCIAEGVKKLTVLSIVPSIFSAVTFETIFIKFLARNSRATAPKIRVPVGFPLTSIITAALSSKRT